MNKYIVKYIAILFLFFYANDVISQEELMPLNYNVQLNNYKAKGANAEKNETDTLELPIIDDFAKTKVFPDQGIWDGNMVFINNTFAKNMVSLGVATFDILDNKGNIHSNASSFGFAADSMISNPIDLDYPGDNSVFLSFFYQPGGIGENPEEKDSLTLDFYDVDSSEWVSVWSASFSKNDSSIKESYFLLDSVKTVNSDTLSNLNEVFTYTMIPVNDERFLKKGTRFRFVNYASISTNTTELSIIGNVDHWHVDFVMLDKDRSVNDTLINDIAISMPVSSLLRNYQAMPWTHFEEGSSFEMKDTISVTFFNLGDFTKNIYYRFEIEDLWHGNEKVIIPGTVGSEHLPEIMKPKLIHRGSINYIYPTDIAADSALFKISCIRETDLTNENIPYKWNDTSSFFQKFYNYYAYDDGIPENGYDIIGAGTQNAKVAVEFDSYKEDTLQGVQIFFNQIHNEQQLAGRYFTLTVWDVGIDGPGRVLYSEPGLVPEYVDSLNQFYYYKLDEKVVIERKFYIGWQKTSTESLNVGFDMNNDNSDKVYYNWNGEWLGGSKKGSIMIRPVFGKEVKVQTGICNNPKSFEFNMYPNPASDYLNLDLTDFGFETYKYEIINSYGQIVETRELYDSYIELGAFKTGIYFIRLTNSKAQVATKKVMIVK